MLRETKTKRLATGEMRRPNSFFQAKPTSLAYREPRCSRAWNSVTKIEKHENAELSYKRLD